MNTLHLNILATTLALLIIVSMCSSGCIQIHTLKGIFVKPKPHVKEYQITTLLSIAYKFNVDIYHPEKIKHIDRQVFEIKKDTKWVDISISVIIRPIPGVIREFVKNTTGIDLENIKRYVDITITTPNGEEWWHYRYNETNDPDEEPPVIWTPDAGTWSIAIDAQGLGSEAIGYQDEYELEVVAKEPL